MLKFKLHIFFSFTIMSSFLYFLHELNKYSEYFPSSCSIYIFIIFLIKMNFYQFYRLTNNHKYIVDCVEKFWWELIWKERSEFKYSCGIINDQFNDIDSFNYKIWNLSGGGIYIYKVVISVCLFVFPIITQKPLNQFASNFDWDTRSTTKMFLAWFKRT